MKVIEMPSSRARSSARADSSSAISLRTWASAARTLAPAELVMTYDPVFCTYTITNRAPCLRASPAAYEPAREAVTDSSTPARITEGPSVPSSNSPGVTVSSLRFRSADSHPQPHVQRGARPGRESPRPTRPCFVDAAVTRSD
jgi:hypothetical protein